ncbi:MAG: (2Fe-2S) ferredoxin domain-containing protein, partial [Bacteroidota bacterium]|nr:(2Fe-2S) ferredoxin domain-containing protein [Bacteroidota bacterium]
MKPTDLKSLQNQHISDVYPSVPMILVGMGTCGIGNGADAVFFKLKQYIETKQLPYILKKTGCFGYCSEEPLVTVYIPGKPLIVYHRVCGKDIAYIVKDIEKEKPYS